MKLESEDNRVSKKPKVVESVDKQHQESEHNLHVSAMERAERIRANLSSEFESFVKPVLKSHVSGIFRMYLPWLVWGELPENDGTVVLVDENGQAYPAKYYVQSHSLGGGWRAFSTSHKLLEGDALVFHLIEPRKFKVFIVRAQKDNGTPGLHNKDSNANPIENDKSGSDCDSSSSDDILAFVKKEEEDDAESAKLSESVSKFKDIKCFKDFKIRVGDLIIDSDIPTNIRRKYYELCCSQKIFLHDHLIEGLSSKFIAAVISETIKIVDATRAANITTSFQCLKCWDKILKSFEALGFSVGFLRTRLHKLVTLSCESLAIIEARRDKLTQFDEAREAHAASILKIKEAKALFEVKKREVEVLKVKNEKLELEFMEIAGAT